MQVYMAAAGFTVTADRMSVVNFSMSIDAQPYTFMFARPKQLNRAYLFIQPYTPNVMIYREAMATATFNGSTLGLDYYFCHDIRRRPADLVV